MRTQRGDLDKLPAIDLNKASVNFVDDFDDKYYQTYIRQEISLNRIRLLFLLVVIMAIVVRIAVYIAESSESLDAKRRAAEETQIGVSQGITVIQRVSGEAITNSRVLIDISYLLGEYNSVLRSGEEFSRLTELTFDGSFVAEKESEYRRATQKIGDANDCSARALRGLGSFVSIGKIKDVVLKDGVYHCYVDISIPDADALWEFYLIYAYDITRYISIRGISTETLTTCMLTLLEGKDLPMQTKEVDLQLVENNGVFVILDDSVFEESMRYTYDKSIDCMTELLGSRLSLDLLD